MAAAEACCLVRALIHIASASGSIFQGVIGAVAAKGASLPTEVDMSRSATTGGLDL